MYKDLQVWQKAYKFVLDIYQITRAFPREEMFGLTSQMRRAVSSIPANIAEGSMRGHSREFQQFIHLARGSRAEMEVWLQHSCNLKYIEPAVFGRLSKQCDEIGRLLNGLLKSIRARP